MCVAAATPATAQIGAGTPAVMLSAAAPISPHAVIQGVVLDAQGQPLAGAVVSAFGSTTVFAVSDPEGRFSFRNVPYGPYLVRAHLQGYLPPRARLIQVDRASLTVSAIALARSARDDDAPVLTAGVGPGEGVAPVEEPESHDHGEVAWRLRHLKRSVLKDAVASVLAVAGSDDTFLGDSLNGLGRAIGSSARLASFLADVPWNGHVDLLTSTSFDHPQELLSMQAWPRGVAFISLEAPTAGGRWEMRGALTQGELSSWIVATSFRRAPAAHRYEAGWSYGTQSSLGGAVAARSAAADLSRTVGALYASDEWAVTPRVAVAYGAKYARYDYLTDRGLFSPRASVTVTPVAGDTFHLRAAVSQREIAPGAEAFIPPPAGPWLPPERTFSALSARRGFTPERLDHVELSAERAWGGDLVTRVRAFHQRVDDQLLTLFGLGLPGAAGGRGVGHYYVASAGDVDARGWGVRVSRTMAARLRASVDYTRIDARWLGESPDAAPLSLLVVVARPNARERVHDVVASVDSSLPVTDTRVSVLYAVNSRFDTRQAASGVGARFDVRVTQALPFLNFAGAEVEMLMAVRSLFRDELLDDASVYDEILAVRPPKRMVGGVTVRF